MNYNTNKKAFALPCTNAFHPFIPKDFTLSRTLYNKKQKNTTFQLKSNLNDKIVKKRKGIINNFVKNTLLIYSFRKRDEYISQDNLKKRCMQVQAKAICLHNG